MMSVASFPAPLHISLDRSTRSIGPQERHDFQWMMLVSVEPVGFHEVVYPGQPAGRGGPLAFWRGPEPASVGSSLNVCEYFG